MADETRWIRLGKITSAHGIQGEVKIALYLDDAEFLREHKRVWLEARPRRELVVTRLRATANQLILRFEGIEDRTTAEGLRGRELSIPLGWLPPLEEGEYYVAQIVGLAVRTVAGEPLGTVAEVLFTGANEVYVVRDGPHGEVLIPAIASVVQAVDLDAGTITVDLPEGLIE